MRQLERGDDALCPGAEAVDDGMVLQGFVVARVLLPGRSDGVAVVWQSASAAAEVGVGSRCERLAPAGTEGAECHQQHGDGDECVGAVGQSRRNEPDVLAGPLEHEGELADLCQHDRPRDRHRSPLAN